MKKTFWSALNFPASGTFSISHRYPPSTLNHRMSSSLRNRVSFPRAIGTGRKETAKVMSALRLDLFPWAHPGCLGPDHHLSAKGDRMINSPPGAPKL